MYGMVDVRKVLRFGLRPDFNFMPIISGKSSVCDAVDRIDQPWLNLINYKFACVYDAAGNVTSKTKFRGLAVRPSVGRVTIQPKKCHYPRIFSSVFRRHFPAALTLLLQGRLEQTYNLNQQQLAEDKYKPSIPTSSPRFPIRLFRLSKFGHRSTDAKRQRPTLQPSRTLFHQDHTVLRHLLFLNERKIIEVVTFHRKSRRFSELNARSLPELFGRVTLDQLVIAVFDKTSYSLCLSFYILYNELTDCHVLSQTISVPLTVAIGTGRLPTTRFVT